MAAKRQSMKERLQRKAEEAEAAEQEKAEKAAKKKAAKKTTKKTAKKKTTKKKTTKKKVAAARRQRVVWKVFNASFKEVASFDYPAKKDADAAAVKHQEKSGSYHFVNAVKIPIEDDE